MAIQVSSRDKQLLMVLPAIVVVIGYVWFFTKAPNQQLKALIGRINTANSKAPSRMDIAGVEARAAQLQREITAARQEIEPLRLEVEKLTAPWMDPKRRAAASEVLTELWGRHRLFLASQQQVAEAQSRLSPTLTRLVDRARSALGGPGPGLWELRLFGSYPDMQAALEEVAVMDQPVVPVSLEMLNTAYPREKQWRVWLWQ